MDGYEDLVGVGPFAASDVPGFAGISGGRTSAMMAALLDPSVTLSFQNTGEEHEKTLEFLLRLQDAIRREIVWLEFRPPSIKAARPKDFSFARVTPETCVRGSNELFIAALDAYNDYRDSVGKKRLTPWARGRLCTALLKIGVKESWIRSLKADAFDDFVGLRADEPDRVSRIKERETRKRSYCTPLAKVGVTKSEVLRFWSRQPFDLEIDPDLDGNCTGCFLKSQGTLSRAMGKPSTDTNGWIELQTRYPGFGGPRPTYAQLLNELPTRERIESTIRAGEIPVDDGRLTPRRFVLVVRQEEKRLREAAESFSCACEQSIALADGEDDVNADDEAA